jgi:ubiquinone/menaquinone biosynthesis C-methylase UbiE
MNEWNRKRKVMRHYDRIARIYDRQYTEEQKAKIDAIVPHMCLDEESFVLDAGCGTGILFPIASIKVQSIIGVDISSKLLQEAKQYTRKFSNVHIICADSDYLPLQNRIFNRVFAITLLQNTPNPSATLEEIKRTSKIQAIIAVTALKKEFSKENFTKLLQNAQLKILMMKTDEKLKDYIVICQTQ